jgi:Repeat of unknown function (DUF5648)
MKWSRMHVVGTMAVLVSICWSTPILAEQLQVEDADAVGGSYFSEGFGASPVRQVISDDFDDNRQGGIWSLDVDDPSSCWLDEANQRLELRATSRVDWSSALYLAKGWTIDPAWDFSLQIDFRQDARLGNSTWLSVIVTPDVDNRASQHVAFGAGTDDSYPYLWIETIDESIQYTRSASRGYDEGTLYISYDASVDELYVSGRGHGAENAWATVRDLLQGVWAGQAITVGLGGGANGVRIDSGQAYLDNFILETGASVPEQPSAVYRFWSPVLMGHFYTISEVERDRLVKKYADVWTLEGQVFQAGAMPFDADLAPVYRFWAPKAGAHMYTIDKAEKDRLVKAGKDVWVFEGVAFYAYPDGRQPKGTKPVYRFSNEMSGGQFYTISEHEKDWLLKNYRDIFIFEGIGFHAYE